MNTHYIAMGGLHGYLPSHCQSYDTLQDAIDSLVELYELGRIRKQRLTDDLYLELNLHGIEAGYQQPPQPADGNEYCEIIECDCDTPEIHNDY